MKAGSKIEYLDVRCHRERWETLLNILEHETWNASSLPSCCTNSNGIYNNNPHSNSIYAAEQATNQQNIYIAFSSPGQSGGFGQGKPWNIMIYERKNPFTLELKASSSLLSEIQEVEFQVNEACIIIIAIHTLFSWNSTSCLWRFFLYINIIILNIYLIHKKFHQSSTMCYHIADNQFQK